MTYRSWHLITIRSVATSWAFAAEIISMINTAMSFGAGLVGAEINLENTQQRNGHKSKHIVAAEICSFITYSKMFLPSIRIWRIHSHTHTHTRPSNAISYACTRCSGRSKLNQYPFRTRRQLPAGWSPSTFSSGNCRGICFQYKILIILGS